MEDERETAGPGAGDPSREIRLEGARLVLAGALLAAALIAAFYAGRWVERGRRPAGSDRPAGGRTDAASEEVAGEDLGFFDTLSGAGKEAEPRREAGASRSGASPPPAAARAGGAGPFCVQVFAGRDRAAAEEIVRTLSAHGHAVRIDAEREGRGAIFKVRVGRYATRAEAKAVQERLVREGQGGAWVTRAD